MYFRGDVETRRQESLREEKTWEVSGMDKTTRKDDKAPLKKDRQRRVESAGEDVERLLTGDPPLPREAWRRMRGWYRVRVYHALPPV